MLAWAIDIKGRSNLVRRRSSHDCKGREVRRRAGQKGGAAAPVWCCLVLCPRVVQMECFTPRCPKKALLRAPSPLRWMTPMVSLGHHLAVKVCDCRHKTKARPLHIVVMGAAGTDRDMKQMKKKKKMPSMPSSASGLMEAIYCKAAIR